MKVLLLVVPPVLRELLLNQSQHSAQRRSSASIHHHDTRFPSLSSNFRGRRALSALHPRPQPISEVGSSNGPAGKAEGRRDAVPEETEGWHRQAQDLCPKLATISWCISSVQRIRGLSCVSAEMVNERARRTNIRAHPTLDLPDLVVGGDRLDGSPCYHSRKKLF
jgi:hypothetical protein